MTQGTQSSFQVPYSDWKDRFARAGRAITRDIKHGQDPLLSFVSLFVVFGAMYDVAIGAATGAAGALVWTILPFLRSGRIPISGVCAALLGAGVAIVNVPDQPIKNDTFNASLNEVLSSTSGPAAYVSAPYSSYEEIETVGRKILQAGFIKRVCKTPEFTIVSFGDKEPLLAFPTSAKRTMYKSDGAYVTEAMWSACPR